MLRIAISELGMVSPELAGGCLNSAFLGLYYTSYGPSFSGHGYPTQCAANTSCPRSDRFWLLELRVSRTFLYQLRLQLLRPWIPSSARGIDGGPRRSTEVVLDERS